MARVSDGRFIKEEGLNFNICVFTIPKYLIAAIFPWFKLIGKIEILNIFDTTLSFCNECLPCIFPLSNSTGSSTEKLN